MSIRVWKTYCVRVHILATGLRAGTWRRRTGTGRRTGKRKSLGIKEEDREDNEDIG